MDKKEIIHYFGYTICRQMMHDNMYYVNTKEVIFDYDDEGEVKLDNVTWLCFSDNFVYFNDKYKYDMNKMNGGFRISTEPSEEIHPAVQAFAMMASIFE